MSTFAPGTLVRNTDPGLHRLLHDYHFRVLEVDRLGVARLEVVTPAYPGDMYLYAKDLEAVSEVQEVS